MCDYVRCGAREGERENKTSALLCLCLLAHLLTHSCDNLRKLLEREWEGGRGHINYIDIHRMHTQARDPAQSVPAAAAAGHSLRVGGTGKITLC